MSKAIFQRVKATEPLLTYLKTGGSGNQICPRICRKDVAGRRSFSVTYCLLSKAPPQRKANQVIDIPGLERITYAERMHYVPGLSKPTFPHWRRDWHDPYHYYGPKCEEMPLHKDTPCYIFTQRTSILEGVRQALWLSKSKLIQGLPVQILSLAEDPANQIENQDQRVQEAIRHSRFWDTTEVRPRRDQFCPTLLKDLLHLCGTLQTKHPSLSKRMLAQNYSLSTYWNRDADLFQVRGKNGMLLNSASPVPVVAGKEEVKSTEDYILESFYPISPTIDLQCTRVYQEKSHTGFGEGYPYPHAHTLFFSEAGDAGPMMKPEQIRAKMIMFSFGNALARAHALYGVQPQVLEQPIVVQSVATDGRTFQFAVFQLNSTELGPDTGIKNLVWLEPDQPLYDYAKCRPLIKRKVVQVPAGLSGYQPDTFKKFLALYLHGAV
ncbi:large ribosomal subunit protein mL37 [Amia ocellicauda]|uniref:large ribosomal subunit protein mL37 n=1 Tax=Amia ocellicauda TaxID=2972642 RepID=UPI00346437C3